MRLAMLTLTLALASCGTSPVVLPPNTEQACDRAIECANIDADDRTQCVLCLEHVRPIYAEHAEDEPISSVSCERLDELLDLDQTDSFHVCINENWVWK